MKLYQSVNLGKSVADEMAVSMNSSMPKSALRYVLHYLQLVLDNQNSL